MLQQSKRCVIILVSGVHSKYNILFYCHSMQHKSFVMTFQCSLDCISLDCINETPSYGIFKSVTSNPTLLLMTIYGIWNLDFFRYVIPPFCISPSLTSLQALALEYVIAIYPLVLILVAYICVKLYDDRNFFFGVVWMPFKKFSGHLSKDYNIKNSLLITFGTFLQFN